MAVSSLNLQDALAPVKTKLADGQQANIVVLGPLRRCRRRLAGLELVDRRRI
jgi:hypothetical protein